MNYKIREPLVKNESSKDIITLELEKIKQRLSQLKSFSRKNHGIGVLDHVF